jgi:hypothetical protein
MDQPMTDLELDAMLEASSFKSAPAEEVGYGKRRGDGAMRRYLKVFNEDELALMNAVMGENLRRWGYEA